VVFFNGDFEGALEGWFWFVLEGTLYWNDLFLDADRGT
jgi:hypothetical protein